MLKQNKAITLIALIITIIVLLILAGVVINLTMGDNGIIGKVQTAVGKYENAQEKENSVLAGYEKEIDNASRETVTMDKEEYEQMKNDIKELKYKQENKLDNDKIIIEYQTHTTSAWGDWDADNKSGYKVFGVSTGGNYYIIKDTSFERFRVYNASSQDLTASNCVINTSVSAYVLYVKI